MNTPTHNYRIRILVVDDDEVTRNLLREVLVKEGYSVYLSPSGEDAIKAIQAEVFPVILSDMRMLELDGLAVLKSAKRQNPFSVVILMTGFGSMSGAMSAIREGAFDYISKPFKMDQLKMLIQRAIKHWEISQKSTQKSKPLSGSGIQHAPKALIGKSAGIIEVYKSLARAALSNSNILLIGESGTGKELMAHAIHENSAARDQKLVLIRCSGTPDDVLEKELFNPKTGCLFSSATVFLDEISHLSLPLQVRLLTEIAKPDFSVRIIAATQEDMEPLVRAGKFREDLYYRLKVITIEIPPLRSRIEDLPELVEHFIVFYSNKNNKQVSHVSEEAMAALTSHPWPGNVRELESAIERAVVMSTTHVLFPEDFLLEASRQATSFGVDVNSLEQMEKEHILRVLQDVNYNKSKASEVLGIDRATLYRKAQRYGINLQGK